MELNHHRTGEGEPLLLLHGTGSQWQIWKPVIELIAPYREVIAVDLPGFGGSRPLPADEAPTPSRLARLVAGFAAEIGIPRPHIAGNSNGAWVALEMAKMGSARSVLGIAPMGLWKGSVPTRLDYPIVACSALARRLLPYYELIWSRPRVRSAFMHTLVGRPAGMPAEVSLAAIENLAWSPGFMATVKGLRSAGRFEHGRDLEIPVTMAFGTRDVGVRMRDAKRHGEIPDHTRWVTLRGCGHVPFYDAPDLVGDVMLAASESAAAA